MKKVIKPKQNEEAVYYSDFTGKCFGEWEPDVNLTLEFNYGSKYDGSVLKFDLSDDDVDSILELIKTKLTKETKIFLRKQLSELESNYEDNIQSRDWESCSLVGNNLDLIEKLI